MSKVIKVGTLYEAIVTAIATKKSLSELRKDFPKNSPTYKLLGESINYIEEYLMIIKDMEVSTIDD